MASNEEIIKEANYYLEHDENINESSSALGISRRTFQIHMEKLKDISPEKYKLVKEKKENNIRLGVVKGGSIGKRGPSWSDDDANMVAKKMVEKSLTYQEAEKELGIPKSTLHEMTHKGNIDEVTESLLYRLALANKKGVNPLEITGMNSDSNIEAQSSNKTKK